MLEYDSPYVMFPDWYCIRLVYGALRSGEVWQIDAALDVARLADHKTGIRMVPCKTSISLDSPLLSSLAESTIRSLQGQFGTRKDVLLKLLWAEECYETLTDAEKEN